jgi:hypothetical protein
MQAGKHQSMLTATSKTAYCFSHACIHAAAIVKEMQRANMDGKPGACSSNAQLLLASTNIGAYGRAGASRALLR